MAAGDEGGAKIEEAKSGEIGYDGQVQGESGRKNENRGDGGGASGEHAYGVWGRRKHEGLQEKGICTWEKVTLEEYPLSLASPA